MTVHIQHYDDYVIVRLRATGDGNVAHLEQEVAPGEYFMDFEYTELRALGEGEIESEVFDLEEPEEEQ